MSKRTISDVSDREFDDEFNPAVAVSRMPTNMAGALMPMSEYAEISCKSIVEYQNKCDSDFREWPEEEFQALVASIRANGVFEAVIVRPLKDTPGTYEMLAGEHRWKASKAAGLPTIPARILSKCSDEKAECIFSVTNVLRRTNSIRDKVNGWWHYLEAIRFKGPDGIDEMVNEGIISSQVVAEANKGLRTVYKYAKLHDLIGELLNMVDRRHISIEAGNELAALSISQQTDLLPYKHYLNKTSKATQLKQLAFGKIDGMEWNEESIKSILFEEKQSKAMTLKDVASRVRAIVSERMIQSAYADVEDIVTQAIDAYLEEHPEMRKGKA